MHIRIYIYIHMNIIYIFMYVLVYVYVYAYVYAYVYVYVDVCANVDVYVCVDVYACMNVCMYAGLHVCMYVFVYVCVYVCIWGCPKLWYPKTPLRCAFANLSRLFAPQQNRDMRLWSGFRLLIGYKYNGIQTFREPYAALSRPFATAAKHTRILKALHGFEDGSHICPRGLKFS